LAAQIKLFKNLVDKFLLTRGKRIPLYAQSLQQVLSGLQYSKEAAAEELFPQYRRAYSEYYQPFMIKHAYILENYLVNYAFMNTFPFNYLPSILDEYIMLSIHYLMLEIQLIGLASFHQGLNQDLVIKLISSFTKAIGHQKQYLIYLLDLFKRNGYHSAKNLALLIKA